MISSGLVEAHLHYIRRIVFQEKDINEDHTPPLINIEKWNHLKEKALDALRYRDISLEYDEDGLETATAFLQRELQAIVVDRNFSQRLNIKSAELKQNEAATAAQSVGWD